MGKTLTAWTAFIMLLLLGSFLQAQSLNIDEIYSEQGPFMAPMEEDPGIPDTVTVQSLTIPTSTTSFILDVTLYNDEEIGGFNLPIAWDSPDITCDSVSFVGTRIEYVNTKLFSIDNDNQRLQAGMIIFFEQYLQPGNGLIYRAYFSVPPGVESQVINVDSTFYPPGGNFALTLTSGFNFIPQFVPGTITIGDPTNPEISLDPSSFDFTGEEGGANPPSQTLNISNSGTGTLEWSVTNSHGWLTLDPLSGVDEGTVDVSVNLAGLTVGTYYDTIVVTANSANSPQFVPVTLIVESPPPVIQLDPATINVSAVEGSTLPSEQVSVTNIGGGTLEWTAANQTGWLSLNPTSGTGDGVITVEFDLTGLSAGTYPDTIAVSDENATNSPQICVVNLTVTEAPPTIQLDPVSISVTASEGETVPSVPLTVSNVGGGELDWSATNQTAWLSLNPTGGVGDGIITVEFDLTGLSAGTYNDTITVSDENATNSPQITAVALTVETATDPIIGLSHEVMSFMATLGGDNPPPKTLIITNLGGGELNWMATKAADWLTINPTSGVGDGIIEVSVDITGLDPDDVHFDSIFVTDPDAINSPQAVHVSLSIYPVVLGSAIIYPEAQHVIRANAIEPLMDTIYIGNFNLYQVSDINPASISVRRIVRPVSWSIIPSHPDFTGEVMELVVEAEDFIESYDLLWDTTENVFVVEGQFNDGTMFEATGWVTFYGHISGDVNKDGIVDIGDPVYIIDYIFRDGPAPDPSELGDANCDGLVNVGDARYLINYIFREGAKPNCQE